MNIAVQVRQEKESSPCATRGIGFEDVQELFYTPYYLDQLVGEPEQWVAIGWVNALHGSF